jgi:hypothetical protein
MAVYYFIFSSQYPYYPLLSMFLFGRERLNSATYLTQTSHNRVNIEEGIRTVPNSSGRGWGAAEGSKFKSID